MNRFCFLISRSMAQIKANKSKINSQYQHRKIAQFFNIPITNSMTNDEIVSKYLSFLASSNVKYELRKINYISFLQANSQYKIFEYTKEHIAKNFKQITPEAQRAIDSFFGYSILLYNNVMGGSKTIGRNHMLWKDLIDCILAVNQYFWLMTPTVQTCLNFNKSLFRLREQNGVINSEMFTTNYRLCFDGLSQAPLEHLSFLNVIEIFKNMGEMNIFFFYHSNALKFINHFWKAIKDVWDKDRKFYGTIGMVINKLGFYTKGMLDTFQTILARDKLSTFQSTLFVNLLVKFKRINENSIKEKKYKDIIVNLLKKDSKADEKLFFRETVYNFCMAGLWLPEYWEAAFNFLDRDEDNTIDLYKIYVLNRVLEIEKDVIPQKIQNLSGSIKRVLQRNPNFKGEQMINDFNRKQNSAKGLSCQFQIANSLRLINVGSIRTEHLIEFFLVDIIMGNNVVIEVNGNTHYIFNLETGHKEYNIKTNFRSKMLKKLGYHIIDVDLEDFSQGSFDVISNVYKIVKSKEQKDGTKPKANEAVSLPKQN